MSVDTCEKQSSRYGLYFFNFCFFFMALVLTAMGIWIVYSMNAFALVNKFHIFFCAVYLLCVGCVAFSLGALSCCGAIFENKAQLYVFIALMWFLLILEVALAIWIFYESDYIVSEVKIFLEEMLEVYPANPKIDVIQSTFSCCGVTNWTDWRTTSWAVAGNQGYLPYSCCVTDGSIKQGQEHCLIVMEGIYTTGCYEKTAEYVGSHYAIIMRFLILGGAFSVVGICLAYTMTRTMGEYQKIGDIDK